MKLLFSVRLVYTPRSLPSQPLAQLPLTCNMVKQKCSHLTVLQLQVTGSWARAWERIVLSTGSVFQKQGQGIGLGRGSFPVASETVQGRPIGHGTLISPTQLLERGYSLLTVVDLMWFHYSGRSNVVPLQVDLMWVHYSGRSNVVPLQLDLMWVHYSGRSNVVPLQRQI